MLFAKHSIVALSINSFDLKEVVCSSSAFDMEGNHASRVLALDAGTAIPLPTNNALKVKSLYIHLAHAYGSFGGHVGAWNPHCTTKVHPFVQSLCQNGFRTFKFLFIPLQEESIVFRDLGD